MPREEDEPEIVGEITEIEIIAVGDQIREIDALRELYGGRRWRKLKGKAYVTAPDGAVIWAEVHWYECHGIGRRRMKVKYSLEE